MSAETDFVAVLRTVCPRVHPITAPFATEKPFVVYQHIGGAAWRYADNAAADNRHMIIQVTAWDKGFGSALGVIRQIETALCADDSMNIYPVSEPTAIDGTFEGVYGLAQDFEVVAAR